MKPFYATTEDFIKSAKTFISTATTVSATPISVDNNNNFVVNDYVIIGTEGEESVEMAQISSTPTGQIVLSAGLKFDHKINEQVVKIAFNQRKFYGCATIDGTYVLIETKNIDFDNPQGTYFSYTGSVYNYFKATYFNVYLNQESSIDDSVAVQAGDVEHYCSVYEIREEAGFLNNSYVSDGRINRLRLQAESEAKASIASVYSLPLSYVPEIVKTVVRLLAAGWLLYQEYSSDTDGLAKDGISKIREARTILKSIRDREMILMDADDEELTEGDNMSTIAGYPDNTTATKDEDESGGDILFRIKKEF